MRLLYSLLIYLLSPLVLLHLAVRGFRDARYWQRWNERLGFIEPAPEPGCVWVHAASLGEVNAASPLVSALLEQYPRQPLLVTTFTPTGSERVHELFGDRVRHHYVPLDMPGAVRRFFRRQQPGLAVIMETELWPNLFNAARANTIPLVISNARLSTSSLRGYRMAGGLMRQTLACADRVLAQTERDADRYRQLGAPDGRVQVAGNLKFDINISATLSETGEMLRARWGAQRTVLVAGSTHAEDEIELLESFAEVRRQHPAALLILAPRHPERFAGVAADARDHGFSVSERSTCQAPDADTAVFIIDTMGELMNYYAAADVAFVGGTLAPVGGHNLLEPAALAKPVLIGPHTANVREIAEQLLEAGAAIRVHDRHDLAARLQDLFADASDRDRRGRAGQRLVMNGRGALETTLAALQPWLEN